MGVSSHELVGLKCMEYKFKALSKIYFGTVYFTKFILLFALSDSLGDSFF